MKYIYIYIYIYIYYSTHYSCTFALASNVMFLAYAIVRFVIHATHSTI